MPWDSTELWVAHLDNAGMPVDPQLIAGGPEESVIQPEWAPDGSLVFVSDRSGWWNLYRWRGPRDGSAAEVAADRPHGSRVLRAAVGLWLSWYGIADDGTIVAMVRRAGVDELWRFPVSGAATRIDVPETNIGLVQVNGRQVAYEGASPTQPICVLLLDLDSGERRVLRPSFELAVDKAYVSIPEEITFPTSDGDVAHAWYYPPTNPEFAGPADARPPLVLFNHGGPTSISPADLDLGTQFFTSRGFAVVDVNYRGSNGYGRAYMRKLYGTWGVYDVDDCINAARYLASRTMWIRLAWPFGAAAPAGTRRCARSRSTMSSRPARRTSASPISRRLR